MSPRILKRLRSMDSTELRFRAAAAIRSRVGRARTAITPSTWRRESLTLSEQPSLAGARQALAARDWRRAHVALARHFATRETRYVVDPRRLPTLAREILRRFRENDAAQRAGRVLAGEYDILGYRSVNAGSPPDWHRDPVHGRSAPLVFWDAVPYLDPACGDHKITWEINRHQHFLTLGRAFVLTGDRECYREFVVQIEDWIRANPPLQGINWASMLELAFRSLSWLWALHVFAPAASGDDQEPWVIDLLVALDRQLEHIEQNLSRYFSPNTHLSGEALALYVAGRALPELAASARLERIGRTVLLEEAHRQVLSDGGHAERSAHYHRYSTDFYLLAFAIASVTSDDAAPSFRTAAHQQAIFLRAIADDSGRLPLLGDDDGGQLFPICGRPPSDAADSLATAAVLLDDPDLAVGQPPEETLWMCASYRDVPAAFAPRPQTSVGFPETGYYVCRDRSGNHLVFDCGPHGFLNGGHAHADALSVVASVGGEALLVDPGTATYTMDLPTRDRFRSTPMHNTVVIDGRSQSEPGGPFHWNTTTDAHCRVWQPGDSVDYVEAHHDGYLPIGHVRCIFAIHGVGWIIVDHFTGAARMIEASAMWHVHPQWRWARTTDRAFTFQSAQGLDASLAMSRPIHVVRTDGLDAFAPEYGSVVPSLCLAGAFRGSAPGAIATFIAGSAEWQTNDVIALEITPAEGGVSRGVFRIETPAGTLIVLSSTADEGAEWGPGPFRTLAKAALVRLTGSAAVELCSVHARPVASSMQRAVRR